MNQISRYCFNQDSPVYSNKYINHKFIIPTMGLVKRNILKIKDLNVNIIRKDDGQIIHLIHLCVVFLKSVYRKLHFLTLKK